MAPSVARSGLRNRVLEYLDIREHELAPTLWLTLQLMLGMAAVISLKAASDSIFLSRFDAAKLPWVDLTITLLVGLIVGFYIRLSNRMAQGWLIAASQVFLAANLFLLWFLLRSVVFGAAALLYVWVGIFAVLIPSQVWSLAATVFDTRQAKRLFALIGSGGIVGAGLGGEVTSMAGPLIGAENLLLATMVILLGCAGIAWQVSLRHGGAATPTDPGLESTPKGSIRQTFRLVRSRRYLALIAVTLFLSTVVSTLVKYQFKAIAKLHYVDNQAALTSFFGDFYGYIAVLSFLFHTLLTGRLLRWFGLGLSLFILPGSLVIGAGSLLFSTSLGAGILARGVDQAFRHSVDRASLELLYVPIQSRIRNQVKSFLDVVVSRSADGLASVILLILLSVVQLRLGLISWASLLFLPPWLYAAWRLREEYVQTLRSSIERKDISAEALLGNLAESAPAETLELTLQGSDQRAIETAVDWLQFSEVESGRSELASLLNHDSSTIRRKTMAAIAAHQIPGCEKEAFRFLELERDIDARWQALEYLENRDESTFVESLRELLEHEDRNLAATAAARLLHHPRAKSTTAEIVLCDYVEWAASAEPQSRATAARLIGLAPPTLPLEQRLSSFLRDEDAEVARAALHSAASIQPWNETPLLLHALRDRHLRAEARHALAAFGPRVLPQLRQGLDDSSLDVSARREIPRVIGMIGGEEATELLLEHLDQPERTIRYQILRALLRIRREEPDVRFDPEQTSRLVTEELRNYYREAVFLQGIPGDAGQPGERFLRRALQEQLDERLDSVFRLLALTYPRREILDARHWIVSGRAELRSNALEFLDSRLAAPAREMLLPALEDGGGDRIVRTAHELFGLRRLQYPDVLESLLGASDPWLRSCASYVAAETRMQNLRFRLGQLVSDPDPLVAETASLAYARLQQGRSQTSS